jgi:hippurate hydrolase
MMHKIISVFLVLNFIFVSAYADELSNEIDSLYKGNLQTLFEYFHENPELSLLERNTSARLASELEQVGFDVYQGIGDTGVIAILKNGEGPMVMLRADMDGLPIEEKTGLSYASRATQVDLEGNEVFVMHACGHDVHMSSLVGTAQYMSNHKELWSGSLMLIGQPAEERVLGAKAMMAEGIWERFGTPDYALALHVSAETPSGQLFVTNQSPYSGVDTVDIIIHGVGSHGATPHEGIDPIVLGSEIVLALQTIISRELAPRESGVITVGSFHGGTKHNIIPDEVRLQLTVRNDSFETRETLLNSIERIAVNMGRVAGLPDELLPEVIISSESVPPTINDRAFTDRLMALWAERFGSDVFFPGERMDMKAEDFSIFTLDPYIPSTYFKVGGTPLEWFALEEQGGLRVAPHHSALFKIDPHSSITMSVESSVVALLELMPSR